VLPPPKPLIDEPVYVPEKAREAPPIPDGMLAAPPAPPLPPEKPRLLRKPEGEHKSEALKLLVTPAERRVLSEAATRAGLTLSTWLRIIALRAAKTY